MIACDMTTGPCACGAWHLEETETVSEPTPVNMPKWATLGSLTDADIKGELEHLRAIHGDNYGRCKVEPMPATTAGRWTTEPPTVPGWYWWRNVRDGYSARVVYHQPRSNSMRGSEWWTIPIQEPPR